MSQVAPVSLAPPSKPFGQKVFDFVLWGGIILLLISSFGSAEIAKFPLLFSNSENMRQFASGFVNPDFSNWRDLIEKMWLTIQMAIWGTCLAILFAVPMGLLGARNVTPSFIQLPVRRLMDLIRSVPDLVIGTAFLVAVGLGPFAGVMALALNTGGVLAKLFAEAVEA
ncbi:MAG: phosphonate ABC transporter, permease protein PhnE, partial [Phenylobacterium sp.]|nr:phosphonate ABC transporter, permease protein PhnE [Phenylobacterium sp.]